MLAPAKLFLPMHVSATYQHLNACMQSCFHLLQIDNEFNLCCKKLVGTLMAAGCPGQQKCTAAEEGSGPDRRTVEAGG